MDKADGSKQTGLGGSVGGRDKRDGDKWAERCPPPPEEEEHESMGLCVRRQVRALGDG